MNTLIIVITKKADNDESAVFDYITNKFGETYARKFRERLVQAFTVISRQPFIGRPAKNDKEIRVLQLSKQNKIVYKITETEVIILRLLHTKTNLSTKF